MKLSVLWFSQYAALISTTICGVPRHLNTVVLFEDQKIMFTVQNFENFSYSHFAPLKFFNNFASSQKIKKNWIMLKFCFSPTYICSIFWISDFFPMIFSDFFPIFSIGFLKSKVLICIFLEVYSSDLEEISELKMNAIFHFSNKSFRSHI